MRQQSKISEVIAILICIAVLTVIIKQIVNKWLLAAGLSMAFWVLVNLWIMANSWLQQRRQRLEATRPCKHGVIGARLDVGKCRRCSREAQERQDAEQRERERIKQEAELMRKQAYDDFIRRIRLPDYLRSMEPYRFEQLVCLLFQRMGYQAEGTPYTGDNGVDGYLHKNGCKSVLQCKRVKGSVGEPVLRDLYGTMHATGSQSAIVVTTGRVSDQARTWANGKAIRIIERLELQALITEHFQECEVVPLKEPVVVPRRMSYKRSHVKLPVAPANRPVPPGMVAVSTMAMTPSVAVGIDWPVKSADSVSPLAAVK